MWGVLLLARFAEAIELDENSSASRHARALLLDRKGEYHQALHDLDIAIKQEPLNAFFHHSRGLCFRNMEVRATALLAAP